MSAVLNLRHATTLEGLHQTLAESRRRIEELEADGRRLDWLETLRAGAAFWYVPGRCGWSFSHMVRRKVSEGKTLRETIDAAMQGNE